MVQTILIPHPISFERSRGMLPVLMMIIPPDLMPARRSLGTFALSRGAPGTYLLEGGKRSPMEDSTGTEARRTRERPATRRHDEHGHQQQNAYQRIRRSGLGGET